MRVWGRYASVLAWVKNFEKSPNAGPILRIRPCYATKNCLRDIWNHYCKSLGGIPSEISKIQNRYINCCFCVFFVLRNMAKYSQNAYIPQKSVFRQNNILGNEKFQHIIYMKHDRNGIPHMLAYSECLIRDGVRPTTFFFKIACM